MSSADVLPSPSHPSSSLPTTPHPTWHPDTGDLTLSTLRRLFETRELTPLQLINALLDRLSRSPTRSIWITLLPPERLLARAAALNPADLPKLPLFGIPFAVKDNIDVAGIPTTLACKAAAYIPTASAAIVDKLEAAGAILLGKTNLDQFATGLTGVLSDYGPVPNPFNPAYVSGGSSSGSSVAVSTGLVSFALGTDTAGSGRVPAAFNNLVGLKPTKGLLSTRGVFPACRSLDCPSIFALTPDDAATLLAITKGFDAADPFSRPEDSALAAATLASSPYSTRPFRFGVPERPEFHGDTAAAALFTEAVSRLERLGGQRVVIDIAPFVNTGKLLYDGPWLAERRIAMHAIYAKNADAINPVTRTIVSRADAVSAVNAFDAFYKLQDFRRQTEKEWAKMDFLLLPTAPHFPTLEEAQQDARAASAKLGLYTNFVNLLDLSALAIPAGFKPTGLPFGITFIAPAFADNLLLSLAKRFIAGTTLRLGATANTYTAPADSGTEKPTQTAAGPKSLPIAVVGAHLTGQPLNHQLTNLGATLQRACQTAPIYRLYALSNTTPAKPGLTRVPEAGAPIAVEVWNVPIENVGKFLSYVAPPLCIGTLTLDNGDLVKGFLCEPSGLANARDITHYGGWLNYLNTAKC